MRSAFIFITMNFAVDRFGFSADPRLTSADDVMQAWQRLSSTPMAVKEILGSMFLPETVSRLLSRFTIMKPLTVVDYKKLIDVQVESVIHSRLFDKDGRNVGRIEIKLSPKYKFYLFSEAVIPSEGARHTVVTVQSKIASDIEAALNNIPKSSKFSTAPLLITLDFSEAKETVIIKAQITDDKLSQPEVIVRRAVALQFPSVKAKGKVKADRMRTTAHEFGHAFVGLQLGHRFEQIVVVSPKPGIGGYVKFNENNQLATSLISHVFASLGSRAIERIVMSENPTDPKSVLAITSGPSNDIQQATLQLFNALYEFGFDPGGGTIDRNFIMGGGKYADYASLPHDLAEKLGLLLRNMENLIITDLLKVHTQDWYVEKIATLARAGAMTEKDFYSLVENAYPGEYAKGDGVTTHFRSLFAKYIEAPSKAKTTAMKMKQGDQKTSIEENVDRYMAKFVTVLENIFKTKKPTSCEQLLTD
ncbi:MAG: hypothetical protein A2Z20_00335 [Bdellovibrionales bacterium RBG_16_40_8]|nr:MAG: hypothetical protein A2Z20_00335 [Bdellovibrionales bacterium RBG_16_40_8]